MIPEKLRKREDEEYSEYTERILSLKINNYIDLTWQGVADLIYEETGVNRNERTYRRMAHDLLRDTTKNYMYDEASNNEKEILADLILEYKKERVKLSDERVQNNAYIRALSREDTLKEIAQDAVDRLISTKSLLPPKNKKIDSKYLLTNEAIEMISDWHYGITFENHWNSFSPLECSKRVRKLLDETIDFCEINDVHTLHLVNLSDLIAGRIHSTIRLQSRIDVITQVMNVSELLSEYISEITNNGIKVVYYDCLDNHSRIEPIKAESLDIESFVRIISWYLKLRLKDNEKVTIKEDQINKEIIEFKVFNDKYTVGAVHGHHDKADKLIDAISMVNKKHYDLILSAHRHHPQMEEKNETMWISNGSLMGTDGYASNLRLTSKPSQTLILCTENSVYEDIHIVNLD